MVGTAHQKAPASHGCGGVRDQEHDGSDAGEDRRVDVRHERAGKITAARPGTPSLQAPHHQAEEHQGEPQAPAEGELPGQGRGDVAAVNGEFGAEHVGQGRRGQHGRHGERRLAMRPMSQAATGIRIMGAAVTSLKAMS